MGKETERVDEVFYGVVCSTAEGLLMVEYIPSWEVAHIVSRSV
jgi:hypothetical protein